MEHGLEPLKLGLKKLLKKLDIGSAKWDFVP